MLDLVTNYGAVSDSQAGSHLQSGGSYALKDLRYRKDSAGASWQGLNVSRKTMPFVSSDFHANTEVARDDVDGDGDCQGPILSRDEVEISYTHATPGRRAHAADCKCVHRHGRSGCAILNKPPPVE